MKRKLPNWGRKFYFISSLKVKSPCTHKSSKIVTLRKPRMDRASIKVWRECVDKFSCLNKSSLGRSKLMIDPIKTCQREKIADLTGWKKKKIWDFSIISTGSNTYKAFLVWEKLNESAALAGTEVFDKMTLSCCCISWLQKLPENPKLHQLKLNPFSFESSSSSNAKCNRKTAEFLGMTFDNEQCSMYLNFAKTNLHLQVEKTFSRSSETLIG